MQRIVACASYDDNEVLTQKMYYGYAKEGPPIIDAIRTEQLVKMPSDAEVWQIANSKIENLNVTINQSKINRHEK